MNLTEHHPQRGTAADWLGADFVIEQDRDVFHLRATKPVGKAPSEGIFRIEAEEDPATVWLVSDPTPKQEKIVTETSQGAIDPEYRRYFTARSIRGASLVYRTYGTLRSTVRLPASEVGAADPDALAERLRLDQSTKLELDDAAPDLPMMYLARYRIRSQ